MGSITKAKDFKSSGLTLTKPTDNKGIRMSWVKNDGKGLMFQISAPVHYGANDFEGNQKFTLTLALNPENEKHEEFINACNELEKGVLNGIGENFKDFALKNKSDVDTISSKFYKLLKSPKDDSDSNIQLLKLNLLKKKESDEFDVAMYDNENKVIEGGDVKAHLRRGATITAVINVQSVWVNSKKEAGIKLKLQRARIDVAAPASGSSNPFDDMDDAPKAESAKPAGGAGLSSSKFAALEEDEEDDVLADVMPSAAAPAPASAKIEHHIEEDEDEGEVIQPPPVPKKDTKPVKKIVKKTA
jgi:hypothetical protein